MKPRVTQRDVAAKTGVSHVTVSLALRGDISIPKKTRTRIEKAARQLGYAPDPMLTALASYRKQNRPAAYHANIGWMLSSPHAGRLGWGDFSLYYKGAEARAKQLGYVLDEIDVFEKHKDPKQLKRLLSARNITGLIFPPAVIGGTEFKFDFTRFSAVRIGYSYRSPLLHTVSNTQFRTVLTAMQKVVALGYRRIGVILTEELDERTSWQFLGGYHAGLHLLPRENWLSPFYAAPRYASPRIDLAPAVHEWIRKEKIDCLVAPGYRELYHELVRRGLDMPEKVGYADTQIEEADQFFSGIHQNSRQIGVAAVDLLVSMLHRDDTGIPAIPSHLMIEGSWREGKTLRARK